MQTQSTLAGEYLKARAHPDNKLRCLTGGAETQPWQATDS